MRRLWALLLALALLTGCAALPEEEPEENWELYQQGIPEEEEPEAPDPEEAYPAAFSLAYHKDQTLDPITCGEGVQEDVSSLLYEPLVRLDRSFQPVPLLCEGWEWDESGLICTLTLRQDVTFQDGSALTAADAAATLRRAMESERYAYRLRNVSSVAANRAGQVVITLLAPDRGLPALLDIPIVKSGSERLTVPIGTGPYLFVTGEEGSCLAANGDWWQGKRLPLETIPLVQVKDRDTAMYFFSSHRVELLTVDPTDDLESVSGQSAAADRPTAILQYIGFNTAEERLFSSAAARAAFNSGISREVLASAQLAGLALPAQFPVSPLSELYPAELEKAYSAGETLAALRAAGQSTGEKQTLTLLVGGEDRFRETNARFIAESLSLLDWQIQVQVLPWEEYLAALEAGEFDLYYAETRLTANWDLTDLVGTEGILNYGGYTDPATDRLLLAFAAAPEGEERRSAAQRLLARLQDTAPIAPVCFKNYTVLTRPEVVTGLEPTPSTTFAGMEKWSVRLRQEAATAANP